MKTIIRKAMRLSTVAIVAAASGVASAQYYGGLNFDPSRSATTANVEAAPGFFVTNTALDDRRIRYGLKLGYQFSPQFAVVSRYSTFDRRDSVSPLAHSYGLDLDGRIPLFAGLALSGSAGVARLNNEATSGNGYYSVPYSSPGSRAFTAGRLALGMAYQFNGSLGLRFDVERYRPFSGTTIGEPGADHLSLGVMVKF